jgi:hypothetical protein
MAKRTVKDLKNNWEYQYDKEAYEMLDLWRILKPDANGVYHGDCEDFGLTWAFLECDSSYRKLFKAMVTGRVKVWYVLAGEQRGGHAVLEIDGMFVDNWSKAPVSRHFMETVYGHDFQRTFPILSVLYKLIKGWVITKNL